MSRRLAVEIDPATLYWLRGHLKAYVEAGATNGSAPRANRALAFVRDVADGYQDSQHDEVWLRLVVKEKKVEEAAAPLPPPPAP